MPTEVIYEYTGWNKLRWIQKGKEKISKVIGDYVALYVMKDGRCIYSEWL